MMCLHTNREEAKQLPIHHNRVPQLRVSH